MKRYEKAKALLESFKKQVKDFRTDKHKIRYSFHSRDDSIA